MDPPAATHPALTGRVVAILRATSARRFQAVGAALVAGGVRSLEVTLTTDGALEAIRGLRDGLGTEISVGAGSVLDRRDANAAIRAGADYVVSPGLALDVLREAREHDVLAIPGILTPTEAMSALAVGARIVKLFPAGPYGPAYVQQQLAPLPSLLLVPTGGITIEAAPGYLAAGAIAIGMGGPLLQDAAEDGSLTALEDRARRLMALTTSCSLAGQPA